MTTTEGDDTIRRLDNHLCVWCAQPLPEPHTDDYVFCTDEHQRLWGMATVVNLGGVSIGRNEHKPSAVPEPGEQPPTWLGDRTGNPARPLTHPIPDTPDYNDDGTTDPYRVWNTGGTRPPPGPGPHHPPTGIWPPSPATPRPPLTPQPAPPATPEPPTPHVAQPHPGTELAIGPPDIDHARYALEAIPPTNPPPTPAGPCHLPGCHYPAQAWVLLAAAMVWRGWRWQPTDGSPLHLGWCVTHWADLRAEATASATLRRYARQVGVVDGRFVVA